MKRMTAINTRKIIASTSLIFLFGCSNAEPQVTPEKEIKSPKKSHRYGGWYCPDNLNGFPAVDLKDWKNVPVVNDRLPTEEETSNGTSLMYIDKKEYPNAKAMDIKMPQLAKFHNSYSNKEEVIIVIQAIEIEGDSIIGFRYLNGGNGSAHLNEVKFITEKDAANITNAKFISFSININTHEDSVWKTMTNTSFTKKLQPIFDKTNSLNKEWRAASNINYHYADKSEITNLYADKLFGSWYIQNDYLINMDGVSNKRNLANNDFLNNNYGYAEKFFLLGNNETNHTELKIVCGPFNDDYEEQKTILTQWAAKIKELSEN